MTYGEEPDNEKDYQDAVGVGDGTDDHTADRKRSVGYGGGLAFS